MRSFLKMNISERLKGICCCRILTKGAHIFKERNVKQARGANLMTSQYGCITQAQAMHCTLPI